jgi:hypothetical protein
VRGGPAPAAGEAGDAGQGAPGELGQQLKITASTEGLHGVDDLAGSRHRLGRSAGRIADRDVDRQGEHGLVPGRSPPRVVHDTD